MKNINNIDGDLSYDISVEEIVSGLTEIAPKSKAVKARLRVPKSLNIYQVPADIQGYLKELLPHMRMTIQNKIYDKTFVSETTHEILAEFLCWFLSEGKYGTPRYTRYNPVEFPDQAFWSWTITLLKYHIMTYFKKKKQEAEKTPTIQISSLSRCDDDERGSSVLDAYTSFIDDKESGMLQEQLVEFFKDFSAPYNDKRSFEGQAYKIIQMRLQGFEMDEIALRVRVSSATLSSWMKKLAVLTNMFLSGDQMTANQVQKALKGV